MLNSILTHKDVTPTHFPSISNRGKWTCPSRIGALPPGQKCIVAAAREHLSVCVSPGLHLIEWTRHNMDRSQIVAAYNARQSGSQGELSLISVSLESECFLENGCDKGNGMEQCLQGKFFWCFVSKRFCEWWVGHLFRAREYSLGLIIKTCL